MSSDDFSTADAELGAQMLREAIAELKARKLCHFQVDDGWIEVLDIESLREATKPGSVHWLAATGAPQAEVMAACEAESKVIRARCERENAKWQARYRAMTSQQWETFLAEEERILGLPGHEPAPQPARRQRKPTISEKQIKAAKAAGASSVAVESNGVKIEMRFGDPSAETNDFDRWIAKHGTN